MKNHITILAILYIVLSGLTLLGAILAFTAIVGGGMLSGDIQAIGITAGVGTIIAMVLIIIAAPGLLGGIGLLSRRSWARILVIVIGCLNLLNFPFGTALGIYTIWVLTHFETKLMFAR